MDTGADEVVLDTNVFVAAGFNPGSHSARLVEAVRDGRLRMIWDDATHAEIEHIMRQIPRLSWTRIADLFRAEDRFGGSTHPEAFGFVPDPADRKFAALADAVQAPLVTSDAGLLNAGGQMAVRVLKPSEFALRLVWWTRSPAWASRSMNWPARCRPAHAICRAPVQTVPENLTNQSSVGLASAFSYRR